MFELAPAQLINPPAIAASNSLIEGGKFDTKVVYGDRSIQAIVNDICKSVSARVSALVARHRPETVHVFTHDEDDVPGLFTNRGDFDSALQKTSSLDHYDEDIVLTVSSSRSQESVRSRQKPYLSMPFANGSPTSRQLASQITISLQRSWRTSNSETVLITL